MNDGSMFGNLMKYGSTSGNLDFYKESPTIEFDTPEGNADYKIISVFKTNTLSSQGEFFNYMVGDFQNEKDFMNYVYNVRIRSLINCPVDVNEDDQLLTLSTCSYEFTEFRTVVVARKVRGGESSKVNVSLRQRSTKVPYGLRFTIQDTAEHVRRLQISVPLMMRVKSTGTPVITTLRIRRLKKQAHLLRLLQLPRARVITVPVSQIIILRRQPRLSLPLRQRFI